MKLSADETIRLLCVVSAGLRDHREKPYARALRLLDVLIDDLKDARTDAILDGLTIKRSEKCALEAERRDAARHARRQRLEMSERALDILDKPAEFAVAAISYSER